jgi:hypothetical protein
LGDLNYEFVRGKKSGEDMLTATLAGLRKIKDPLKRSELGVKLFGEKWNEVGESAILSMDTFNKGLEDIYGSTDRAGEAMQRGLKPAWERFTRTVKLGLTEALGPYIEEGLLRAIAVLEDLGGWIDRVGIPALSAFAGWIDQSGALDAVASAADWLSGALSDIDPETLALIGVALGGIAAKSMATGIATLATNMGALAVAAWGALVPMLPLLGVLLLIGLIIRAYQTDFLGARGAIDEFGVKLREGYEAWKGIFEGLRNLGADLSIKGLLALDGLEQGLEDDLVTPFNTKVAAVKGLLTGDGLSSLKSTIRYLPAGLMSWLVDLPGQVYSFLGSPFASEIAIVKGLLTGEGVDGLKAGVSAVVGSLPTCLTGLGQAILDNFTTPFSDAIVGIISLITGEDEGTVRATLAALPGQMGEWLSPLGGILSAAFAEPVVGAMNGMISLIELAVNKVIDQINGLVGYDIVEKGLSILGVEKPNIDHIDIPDIAIPTKDSGGRYRAGQPYWIGKGAQPEVFVPRESGTAFPAGLVAALGGAGGINISGPIHLHGVEDPEDFLDRLDRIAKRRNKTLLKKGRTNRGS